MASRASSCSSSSQPIVLPRLTRVPGHSAPRSHKYFKMSETSEKTLVEVADQQVLEIKQTEESNIVQQAVQPEEPRRSERARTLTQKGRD